MGIISWLFGRKEPAKPVVVAHISNGPGKFAFNIVGESHYQENLERIGGPKDEDSKQEIVTATLLLEDDNPHDKNAVAVLINKLLVGHLSRSDAVSFRNALSKLAPPGQQIRVAECKAMIVGGWDRGNGDAGSFGVKLDLPITH
jgi:hypothetical protein